MSGESKLKKHMFHLVSFFAEISKDRNNRNTVNCIYQTSSTVHKSVCFTLFVLFYYFTPYATSRFGMAATAGAFVTIAAQYVNCIYQTSSTVHKSVCFTLFVFVGNLTKTLQKGWPE